MKRKIIIIASVLLLTFGIISNVMSQWVRTNDSIDSTVECLVVSSSSLFAGTTNGIYRSTNNGDDWTRVSTGLVHTEITALVTMGTDLFAAAYDTLGCSVVYRSTNNGTTWSQVSNNFSTSYGCIGIHTLFVKDTNLFVGAVCGSAYLSTNRGGEWIAIDSGIKAYQNFEGTAFGATPTDIFFRTDGGSCTFGHGSVFRSTNNGAVWSSASDSLPQRDLYTIKAFAVMGSTVFAGANQTVYQWTDSNSRWSKVGTIPTTPIGRIQILAVSGSNILAALDEPPTNPFFLSTDSAKTWQSFSTGLEKASKYIGPYSLSLAVNDQYLFVGIYDTGVWRRPLSDITTSEVKNPLQPDRNISLSPNPTSGVITVHNAPANIQHVTITNLLGESVLELAHPNAPEFTLDLSKLPPGTYYGRFSLPSEVITRKIMKE